MTQTSRESYAASQAKLQQDRRGRAEHTVSVAPSETPVEAAEDANLSDSEGVSRSDPRDVVDGAGS